MNNTFKYILLTLLAGCLSAHTIAQTDSTKVDKKVKVKKIDKESSTTTSTEKLKVKSTTIKVKPDANFELKNDKKLNVDAINKKLDESKSKINKHFLLETLPEDKDIIGKKYWKGKDVTHKKLESHLSLGTISSTSRTVKIECRDHSFVDGDRIKIFLNEKVISDNIGLKGHYYVVYVNLEPGYNRIDFQALNQGLSGPNTAELNVYDDKGNVISSKNWNLPTGYIATLGIIKK